MNFNIYTDKTSENLFEYLTGHKNCTPGNGTGSSFGDHLGAILHFDFSVPPAPFALNSHTDYTQRD